MSPDESLLISNKIEIIKSTDQITRTSVDSRIVQDPNATFLGMRWKLAFYNGSKDSVNNRWNRWLKSLGEPPTVFDSSTIPESIDRISSFLNNKGYFEPEVSATIKRKKSNNRKVKVKYFLVLNTPYTINQTTLIVNDDSVAPYLKNFNKETLLKKGIIYDVDVFDNERARIASLLQTAGFMLFGKDKVTFSIDSSLGSHSMNVKVIVMPDNSQGVLKQHQKYYLRDITFLSENHNKKDGKYDTLIYSNDKFIYQDKKPPVRPYILLQKTFFNKGDKYSLENVHKSYENLSELRILGYSNITFSKIDSSGQTTEYPEADCHIALTQNSRYGITFDVEYNTTSGLQGPAVNVSFLDRNIFKGGEVFSLQLGATYEFQVSSKSPEGPFKNVLELSAKARIDFPWFLASPKVSNLFKNYHPKSSLSLGYGFQMKELYWRNILNTAWGYSWRSGTKNHIFNPVEISIVKMLRTSREFEDLLNRNTNSRRLRYQYEDHFVLNLNYSFIYNEQVQGLSENYNYFRIRGETSGALLYLFSKAVKGKMNSYGQYEILGLSFSQYVKFETEYKYCIFFSKNTSLIFRALIGAGFAYGNSKVLPYEKSFFAGGSNTLRAWTLYHVGPGGYAPNSNDRNMERLGDMTILLNAEQRFPIYSVLKGAVFIDAGNIWTLGKENTYVNGKFSKNFYKHIALNTGVGLRLDFNFFLIRVDMGIPMINPANIAPDKKSWMWHKGGITGRDLVFNFGIGYPF
jgi:outer membrane protein assembly factor BamA